MLLIGGIAPNVKKVEIDENRTLKKKAGPQTGFRLLSSLLATQAKLGDKILIGLLIATLDIVKQMAALTDHGQESAA